jgi:hypothetical protein
MCTGFEAALLAGMAGSTYMQQEQAKDQQRDAKKRAIEADKKAAAEKNAMNRNMASAENAPLLINSKGKPGAGGMSKLKIGGGGAGGYSTLGMGGTGGTGLNIPTSG